MTQFLFDLNNQTGTSLTPTINRFIKQTKNQIELNQTELINGDEVFRKIAKKFDK